MAEKGFPKIGHFKDVASFRARLASLGVNLPCDEAPLAASESSPLAAPLAINGMTLGNRWCVHPMEGWDGTTDGQATESVLRRWEHFGASGAKLIWGGEAFAVQADARANPNQLGFLADDEAPAERTLALLLDRCLRAHRARLGDTSDLLIGLQLTHSGRFCKPHDWGRLEPKIAYHHPLLDPRFGIRGDDDSVVLSDDQLQRIIERYIRTARIAQRVGFQFVDVKHCHGYLGHELLSAFTRKGQFGGPLENRTRFARDIIQGIQAACPSLGIGVRLSAFDHPPFKPDPTRSTPGKLGPGVPDDYRAHLPYHYGFGCDVNDPLKLDLGEPIEFIRMLSNMGVKLINISGCSPYYNPHFQRPAMFPPSDGYQPPEDPLVGVARQIDVTRQLKAACPGSFFIGSGYTYLQEYLPHVAQAVVRQGWTDVVGFGRLVLSYWDMPLDTLAGRPIQDKRICRTFSDCTTAPRNAIVSGCYPLDPYYKDSQQHEVLKEKKAELRKRLGVAK